MRELTRVAGGGLLELLEALLGARANDRLLPLARAVWGPLPALSLGLLAVGAGLGGVLLGGLLPEIWFVTHAIWPVVLLSAVAAWRIRAVLRSRQEELAAAPGRSFRALALPLVPAALVLVIVATLTPHLVPAGWPGAATTAFEGKRDLLAVLITVLLSWLASGAGLAVCTATLAGRRAWAGSLFEIGWRYFVFKLMLWVSLLVMGMLSSLIWGIGSRLLWRFLDWRLPEGWYAFFDRMLDAGFASLIFLAFIGGAWSAAESCFPRLLRTGDVHFLHALGSLFGDEDEPAEEEPDPGWPGVEGSPAAKG